MNASHWYHHTKWARVSRPAHSAPFAAGELRLRVRSSAALNQRSDRWLGWLVIACAPFLAYSLFIRM